MPAIVVAGAIAGAGAIGAAAIGASASNKAANKAAQAAQDATTQNNALALDMRNRNEAAVKPYADLGLKANAAQDALMYGNDGGASLNALQQSPGYQFRLSEGNRSINTGYAANGLLQSGAAQKALLKYGQDYASNEYGNRVNQLAQQQGLGLSATNALVGNNTNYTNQVTGQNNANAGAIGNAALVQAQNTNNVLGTAANALGYLGGNYISSYGKKSGGLGGVNAGAGMTGATPPYIPSSLYGGAFF